MLQKHYPNIRPIMVLLLTSLLLLHWSCLDTKSVDLEAAKKRVLELHQQQRAYHFNKDSVAFVSQFSDHFMSVNSGAITQPSKAETQARYHRYFSSVEFVRWDDVTPPEVRISDDCSMAYTVVDKLVVVQYPAESGEMVTDSTHFAWTTVYKKYGNVWKVDCVTSTSVPKD